MNVAEQFPRYRCHKEVHAVKIERLGFRFDEEQVLCEVTIFPARDATRPETPVIVMPAEWFWKHDPSPGGYLVFYENGYRSYSPAPAFENGYTRLA